MSIKSPPHLHFPCEWPRNPTSDTSLFVLVPAPFGGLVGYERLGAGRLREHSRIRSADHLASRIRNGGHTTVVLCGSRHLESVREVVAERADLYLIPLAWLRGIPRTNPSRVAAFAARLVTVHRRAPIKRFCRLEGTIYPF